MDQTNLDIYGEEPIPWSRALDQLEADAAKARGFYIAAAVTGFDLGLTVTGNLTDSVREPRSAPRRTRWVTPSPSPSGR
jgi:hypothetical protein